MDPDLIKKLARFLQGDFMDPFEDTEEFDSQIDWAYDNVSKPALKIMCDHLGHDSQMDQCMLPEHDYCLRCGELTPGQAPQRKKKET